MKQFLVVSYDISNDRRRRKVMQAMEDFGKRVQYSVFECHLKPAELARLKKRLLPFVAAPADSVRFYFISTDDVSRTEVMRGGKGRGGEAVALDRPFYMQ